MRRLYEIPYFPFKANISDETLAGFCITTREIAGIGIAVGIGVLRVEQKNEVVTIFS